ncbi:MAG: glycoside hydrolase family 88 protein [Luteolibacter sp.]
MRFFFFTALFSISLSFSFAQSPLDKPLNAQEVAGTIKRAADWQLSNPNRTPLNDWVIAPLYDGLIDLSKTTGDSKYLAAVIRMGMQSGWMPGSRVYFADDHAVGHAWLDIYAMDPSRKERLTPFKKRMDFILAQPITAKLSLLPGSSAKKFRPTDRWTWCDALYMAPPTLSRLAKLTDDTRYLDFLDAEYKVTYDDLFDVEENLFYRDARFHSQRSPNGRKVFWSRGNGWVFAGIPMMLDTYPQDRPARKFYTELFQKMAPAILATQQPDGLWYPNMLDPGDIPTGETSGSAFFVYGMAWGVNHGLLDREKYWPAVIRGWNALLNHIGEDGYVGYVQPIGSAPSRLSMKSTQLYGTGGVLLAGAEILRGLKAVNPMPPAELLAQAEKQISEDQTPRAYARFFPERKDDLAWENDKVAFRIYGPALQKSTEASGIDAWMKKVPHPVIDRWYADDLAGRRSYHKDHGEGFDGFKVGDSLGCGGIAIWKNDRLITANVYDEAKILYTTPDVVEIEAFYTYPDVDGIEYKERRIIRLRQGERLNEVISRFSSSKKPAADIEVAVGLIAQTPDAQFTFEPERGLMAVWDTLEPGKKAFGMGAIVPAGARMLTHPHTTSAPKTDHALAILRTDEKGEVHYRVGSGWIEDGETTSREAWIKYLGQKLEKP